MSDKAAICDHPWLHGMGQYYDKKMKALAFSKKAVISLLNINSSKVSSRRKAAKCPPLMNDDPYFFFSFATKKPARPFNFGSAFCQSSCQIKDLPGLLHTAFHWNPSTTARVRRRRRRRRCFGVGLEMRWSLVRLSVEGQCPIFSHLGNSFFTNHCSITVNGFTGDGYWLSTYI